MLQEHRYQPELCATGGRKKVERLEPYLHMFAEGRIRVQQDQSWTRSLVNEWTTFPNGRFNDQVDAISQYLEWDVNRRVPKPVIMRAGGSWVRAAAIEDGDRMTCCPSGHRAMLRAGPTLASIWNTSVG